MSKIEVWHDPDWKSLKAAVQVVEWLEESVLIESIDLPGENFIRVVLK